MAKPDIYHIGANLWNIGAARFVCIARTFGVTEKKRRKMVASKPETPEADENHGSEKRSAFPGSCRTVRQNRYFPFATG
jgi:hypothetical protein